MKPAAPTLTSTIVTANGSRSSNAGNAAMKLKKGKGAAMNNTSYRIDVIGQTWGGFRGSYSRPFNTIPDFSAYNWVKEQFGDFESIEDYRVTRLEYHFEQHGPKAISTHTEEIVCNWHSEENAMAFAEMHQ